MIVEKLHCSFYPTEMPKTAEIYYLFVSYGMKQTNSFIIKSVF